MGSTGDARSLRAQQGEVASARPLLRDDSARKGRWIAPRCDAEGTQELDPAPRARAYLLAGTTPAARSKARDPVRGCQDHLSPPLSERLVCRPPYATSPRGESSGAGRARPRACSCSHPLFTALFEPIRLD